MRLYLEMGALILLFFTVIQLSAQGTMRLRDHGIEIGIFPPATWNAITDVQGVKVGHSTLHKGARVHTGATAILPHSGNIYQSKVPAALYIGNGYGKLAGSTQIEELGQLETPILLTNTLSVAAGIEALVNYTLDQPGNEDVRSVNAVVGETNDGRINDIRGLHLHPKHMIEAIENAKSGPVEEGSVGAGTGTVCFGFKGGIGTASRQLPPALGGHIVGVLVQANFGGVLEIAGVPVGKELGAYPYKRSIEDADGSCMIVVATDAPINARNLKRMAKRAMLGLAKTGGFASNGSGDYVIAFSTFPDNLEMHQPFKRRQLKTEIANDYVSPLFLACVEATEEAILNALFTAQWFEGIDKRMVSVLPVDQIIQLFKEYGRLP